MKKRSEEVQNVVKEVQKGSLVDKYGGDALVKKIPRELLLGETEAFVEYSRDGRVLKGMVRMCACACVCVCVCFT